MCCVALVIWLVYKVLQWMYRTRSRRLVLGGILGLSMLALVVHQLFFSKMEFVQSQVYSNLYLVKNLEKDSTFIKQAIIQKLKEHIANPPRHGKKLAFTDTTGIYFYEYYKSPPIFLFADAGTAYFIDNEEDLGGFVSEELGMYTQYRLAECYANPCKSNTLTTCVTIDYFYEGEFVKTDTLFHLQLSSQL